MIPVTSGGPHELTTEAIKTNCRQTIHQLVRPSAPVSSFLHLALRMPDFSMPSCRQRLSTSITRVFDPFSQGDAIDGAKITLGWTPELEAFAPHRSIRCPGEVHRGTAGEAIGSRCLPSAGPRW